MQKVDLEKKNYEQFLAKKNMFVAIENFVFDFLKIEIFFVFFIKFLDIAFSNKSQNCTIYTRSPKKY